MQPKISARFDLDEFAGAFREVGGLAFESECKRDIEEGKFAHRMAEHEAMIVMHLREFFAQLVSLFNTGNLIGAHAVA